ncbi:MAG: tetratricopeptide repeat protein [Acidobacteriota bacterium]
MAYRRMVMTLAVAVAVAACGSEEKIMPTGGGAPVEALSLLGEALERPRLDAALRAEMESELAALAVADGDVDALIWRGRRLAYLGRYRDAIDHYTEALAAHSDDARLLRHRGHRYLTVRRIRLAIADFERAAALIDGRPDVIEPDGLPNVRNEPRSTLGTNVYYHLGIGHTLGHDWTAAVDAYRRCLELSTNDDMRVATIYWLVLALARADGASTSAEIRELLAAVTPDLDIIENHDYHRLLLGFKGELDLDDVLAEARARGPQSAATVGYGVGAWRLVKGDGSDGPAAAREVWRAVVEGEAWPSFGHLAAEAELAGLAR